MSLEVSDLMDVSEKNYTYTEMLQEAKLSTYLADNSVEWVPKMPEGVPPDDILIPHEHTLYRLTKGTNISEEDLITYYEIDPNKDWGDKLSEAYAVSMYDDLNKTAKLTKMASLKKSKGVSAFVLSPKDGVVKQTGKSYHYSWWKTNKVELNSAKAVLEL